MENGPFFRKNCKFFYSDNQFCAKIINYLAKMPHILANKQSNFRGKCSIFEEIGK